MEADFHYTEITPEILQLSDTAGNCATLVLGTRRALLFDTMIGLGDLRAYVRQLTALPLVVVNSHGHLDHMGGNEQFETVWLHPADRPLLPVNLYWVDEVAKNIGRPLDRCRRSYEHTENLRDLERGRCFDLGGITAETVELPGHTAGSVGLLLREKRVLLAGDACTPQMCLFLYGAQPLEVYRRTLDLLDTLPFDGFLLGHYTRLFPRRLLAELRACTDLPGRVKGYEFPYTNIPAYSGKLYIRNYRDPDADDLTGLILPAGPMPELPV